MMIIPENQNQTEEDLRIRSALRETPFGEYMKAKFQEGLDWTTSKLYLDEMAIKSEEGAFTPTIDLLTGDPLIAEPLIMTPKVLTKEEWEQSPYFRKEISWNESMSEARARIYSENYDARRYRDSLIERSPTGFRSVLGFGASLAGQALDPVNYIPILGQAGKAGSVLAKGVGAIRASAGASALEAMVGTAVTEPFVIKALQAQGEDVHYTDAAIDILFSAPIGGLFGAGSGLLHRMRVDTARRRLARTDRLLLGEATEKALADVDAGEAVNVRDVLNRVSTDRLGRAASEHAFDVTFDRDLTPEEKAGILKDRQSIREYLGGLEPQEVSALKLDSPAEYRAVLVGMVEKLFPEGADIRFRTEAGVFDYDHLLTDAVRRNYIHTLPETLRRAHVKVEIAGDDVPKAYLIKKYFDPGVEKDIWDILVFHNDELRSKIARKEGRGRGTVEKIMMGADSEASRPATPAETLENASARNRSTGDELRASDSSTPAGTPESASTQTQGTLESIIPAGGKVNPDFRTEKADAISGDVVRADQELKRGTRPLSEELAKMAEVNGIDPKTGEFAELADIDALRKEGRILDIEEEALGHADGIFKRARDYAEALKTAVRNALADVPQQVVRTVAGNVDRAPSGVRTLGLAISEELGETGRIDLTGQIVRHAEDVAALAQVYRDPRFETLRIIYTKGDEIVAHEGITSRMPGFANLFMPEGQAKSLYKIRDRMQRLGADGYYLLHNHPSGKMEISPADKALTSLFAKDVDGMKGHVVIDSGEYLLVNAIRDDQGRVILQESILPLPGIPEGWHDPLFQAAIPHEALGAQIATPDDVAMIAKNLQAPEGYVTLLFRDAKGEVRAIQEVPVNLLAQVEQATNYLRGRAREFGAQDILAYGGKIAGEEGRRLPKEVEEALVREGTLLDVIYSDVSHIDPHVLSVMETTLSARPEKRFGKLPDEYPGYRVAETPPEYSFTDKEWKEIEALVKRRKDMLLAQGRLDKIDQELERFAMEEGDKMKLAAALQRKHAALNILKRQELEKRISDFAADEKGDYKEAFLSVLYGSHRRIESARKSVSARRLAIEAEWIGSLTTEISREKPELLKALRKDQGLLDNITREMVELKEGGTPGITRDPDAKFMADILARYAEAARLRLNDAGAFIGKLQGWVPQSHDAAKLLKAGRNAWLAEILPKLDLERSFPDRTPNEVREILADVYENIITGRSREITAVQKGEFVGPRNLAKSMGEHRVLHFASADDWLSYQAKYGRGNVFTSLMDHLEHSARMTSLMEALGPNPETMLGSLMESVRRNVRLDPNLPDKERTGILDSLKGNLAKRQGAIGKAFSEVMGETNIPHNLTAARIGSGIRAVEAMAKLGGAVISSMNDVLTFAMNLRFNGKNLFEGYGDAFKALLAGRGDAEQRQIAQALGATYEGIVHDIASRWNAQDSMPGKASALMEKFFQASGLNWWTDTLRSGYARALASHMADQAGVRWADLSKPFRHGLELHGIDVDRWEVIRTLARTAEDGNRYILPETMDTLPDNVIDGLIATRIEKARVTLKNDTPLGRTRLEARIDRLRKDARRDLRTDLMTYFVDELNYGVINPDDRTRAFMVQGQQPGTVLGEAIRFIAQFKSFPIAYTQRILGGRRWKVEGEGLDPVGLANIILGTMAFGYAAMTAKDFLKGKEPRDPRKFETWAAAAVQGGGAGIYGDFLFAKYDRFGGGPVSSVAGPTAGSAGKLIQMASGLYRGETDAGDVLRFGLDTTPFINLWYTRAALDYGLIYHLQEMLSPGTLRRRERKLKEEFNQEYILPPSSVIRRGGGF